MLDNTGVHPESYAAAQGLLDLCGYTLTDVSAGSLAALPDKIKALGEESVARQLDIGVPTLRDVAAELVKPGRDVRDELPAPILRTDVLDIKDLAPGMVLTGTVRNVVDFGAFVDIGGVDGMVHISELSWSRIKHPSEVVSVGDPAEVYVISFDPEKKKISLGMKDRSQDPWTVFTSKYGVGDVATVKVVKLMTFGAFAEIVPGVDGLIHISQIADHRIDKPGDVLSEGQMVDVKITDIDMENKKVSLSIRALLEDAREAKAQEGDDAVVATSDDEGTEVAPGAVEE